MASRPGIAGQARELPVATSRWRAACWAPATSTRPGPTIVPRPRRTETPLSCKDLVAAESSPCSRSPSRRSTADAQAAPRSPTSSAFPAAPSAGARPSVRRTSADRSIALLGMQAAYGHSAPTRRSSITATLAPADATMEAAISPADPPPSTIKSKVGAIIWIGRRVSPNLAAGPTKCLPGLLPPQTPDAVGLRPQIGTDREQPGEALRTSALSRVG